MTDAWAYKHRSTWRRGKEDWEQVWGLCCALTLLEVMTRSLLDCWCQCWGLFIHRLQSSVSEERGQAILKHELSKEHSVAWCLLFTTSSLGPSLPMAEWESTSKQILLLLSTPWTWGEITLLCSLSLHSECLDSSRFFITKLLPTPGFHCQTVYWLFKVVSIVRIYTAEFFVKNFLYNSYCCL